MTSKNNPVSSLVIGFMLDKKKKELLNQFLRTELNSLIETLIRFFFSFKSNFFCNKFTVASIAVDVI